MDMKIAEQEKRQKEIVTFNFKIYELITIKPGGFIGRT